METLGKKSIWIIAVLCLMAGICYFLGWAFAAAWLIFLVIIITAHFWMGLTLRLLSRCPRCRRFGTIQMIGANLHRKGVDSKRDLEFTLKKKDISSLDISLDVCDLVGRYRCKDCRYEWEEKPPPGFRPIQHLSPPENGEK